MILGNLFRRRDPIERKDIVTSDLARAIIQAEDILDNQIVAQYGLEKERELSRDTIEKLLFGVRALIVKLNTGTK